MAPDVLEKLINQLHTHFTQAWRLGPTHGPEHWRRVERNGILLADEGVNLTVVRLFAYFHDCCRRNDSYDEEHGPHAAEMLLKVRHPLLSGLTDTEFRQLYEACRLHTTSHATGDPTIDACFDADRLDLTRIDIIPDPERMATARGKAYSADLSAFDVLCRDYASRS